MRALDADSVATQVATYTWTVDTSAPTFTATPASTSANANPSFGFTHSAASYTFECKLDGGAFSPCTSPHSLSALVDGPHTFIVRAIDADGVVVPTTASHTWTVNTTAPAITAKPQSPSANTTPSFSFSHSVGSYTFECKVDAGSFATCTSPNVLAALADGSHTFTVRALDADGFAVPTTAAYTWTLNTAPPTITAKPSNPSANASPSFSFNHGAYAIFECKLDGGSFGSCSSPKNYSSLGDGSHTFQVRALDADGVATTIASYTWTVNTAAPTITAKPSNPSANASPSFSFNHGAYTSFECKLDGGSFGSCISPKNYSSLGDALHTFQVKALDADGVSTTVFSYTWAIVTFAPSITANPTNPSASSSASFSFNHSAYSSFQCELDAGSFGSCSSPKSYSSLADGSHTFYVRAVDADGITTTAASFTWTIDTTSPTSTITFPANGSSYNNAGWTAGCNVVPFSTTNAICGTASDTGAGATGVAQVRVSIKGPSGKFWNGTDFNTAVSEQLFTATGTTNWTRSFAVANFATAGGGPGTYIVSSYAQDVVGNTQASATTSTFTLDNTAPTLQTLEMFDTNGDGKVDQVKATFSETLGTPYSAPNSVWTLANAPAGVNTLTGVSVLGAVATLTPTLGAVNTAAGTYAGATLPPSRSHLPPTQTASATQPATSRRSA